MFFLGADSSHNLSHKAFPASDQIFEIAQFYKDLICALIPTETGKANLEIAANQANLEQVYDTVVLNQALTHASLNWVNLQLPKLDAKLDSLLASSSGRRMESVDGSEDIGNDATDDLDVFVTKHDLEIMEQRILGALEKLMTTE